MKRLVLELLMRHILLSELLLIVELGHVILIDVLVAVVMADLDGRSKPIRHVACNALVKVRLAECSRGVQALFVPEVSL